MNHPTETPRSSQIPEQTTSPQETPRKSLPPHINGFSAEHPGIIIILIDQSESMGDFWPGTRRIKAEIACDAVSSIGRELSEKCRVGGDWGRKVCLAVAGYSGSEGGQNVDYYEHDVVCHCMGWPDVFGPYFQNTEILPMAEGTTPLVTALSYAIKCIRDFQAEEPKHLSSFPPVIINITDGQMDGYANGDAPNVRRKVEELKTVGTDYGDPVLLNLLIDPDDRGELIFPHDVSAENLRGYGQFLYRISSPLPEYILEKARRNKHVVSDGSRGLVITQKAEVLVDLLRWGSFQKK